MTIKRPRLHNVWVSVLQVIVEKVSGSQIVDIDKRKYLVPADITVAQFMWIIRKRIQLPSEKAIFLFIDKTVPQSRWDNTSYRNMDLLVFFFQSAPPDKKSQSATVQPFADDIFILLISLKL